MIWDFLARLRPNRESFEWLLVMFTVMGFFVIMAWKGTDLASSICVIVGSYLSAKATVKASAHWAASKDPNADSSAIIKETLQDN
jgi:hypothetical protein